MNETEILLSLLGLMIIIMGVLLIKYREIKGRIKQDKLKDI